MERTIGRLLRQPSAFMPLVLSFAALALVVGHVIAVGVTREADEGAAAHLWQLLMAGQLPVIAYFALRWLPVRPREATIILAVHAVAAGAAAAPVLLLGL
jgi:hypothetical protein